MLNFTIVLRSMSLIKSFSKINNLLQEQSVAQSVAGYLTWNEHRANRKNKEEEVREAERIINFLKSMVSERRLWLGVINRNLLHSYTCIQAVVCDDSGSPCT